MIMMREHLSKRLMCTGGMSGGVFCLRLFSPRVLSEEYQPSYSPNSIMFVNLASESDGNNAG